MKWLEAGGHAPNMFFGTCEGCWKATAEQEEEEETFPLPAFTTHKFFLL